ncbi:unnamed protein product [Durusdinium trenchii]|uniref:RNA helicase n=1 Tax=Durusdinium trenchii TaxID=1381693 RepID=A0ABP0QN21_9DINO
MHVSYLSHFILFRGHSFEGFALKGKGINSGGIGESFRHPTKVQMFLQYQRRLVGFSQGHCVGAFDSELKPRCPDNLKSTGGQHQKREDEWNFEEKRSGQSSEFLKTEAVENGRIREDYCLRLFKQAHVSAGIDFDKYDNIEVTTHGGAKDVTAIETFQEACERYSLPDELTANIQRCGYGVPTPVQKHSIPAVLEGNDVLVTAQTGSGKTAAFLIPIITAALKAGPKPAKEGAVCPTSVVLSPTRELCQQITVEAERLTFRSGARVCAIYGGADAIPQLRKFAGGIEIVVCTPGRLEDFLQRGVLSMKEVKFLALDEADRMLDMGRSVHSQMMFSATFPSEIQELAGDFLDSKYRSISVGAVGATTSSVEQRFEFLGAPKVKTLTDATSADKFELLLDALKEVEGEQGAAKTIVFANSKDMVDDLRYRLRDSRVRCTSMHGGVSQAQRDRALSDLKGGLANVLVATDVAARGLDLPGIDHVINYDLPQNAEDYVHRVGRTGRIGNKGVATSFVGRREPALKDWLDADALGYGYKGHFDAILVFQAAARGSQ